MSSVSTSKRQVEADIICISGAISACENLVLWELFKSRQKMKRTTGGEQGAFQATYLAAKIPRFEEWLYVDGSACHVECVRKCAKWQSALYLLQSMEDTFLCIVSHTYPFCKSWAHNRSTPIFGCIWISVDFQFFSTRYGQSKWSVGGINEA